MHITELTTPYVKRKIIEYGSGRNYNTPVRHWHEMQQVAGPLYKSKETKNEYGRLQCGLYLLYDDVPAGLCYARHWNVEDNNTPEYFLERLQADGLASLSGYLDNLKRDMEDSRWVGLADIEFVKQFDEDMAQRISLYREGRLEQREQSRQKRESERQAKKAAAAEELRKEKQAQRDAFLGWADGMSELRFGQVRKIMEHECRFNGTVMTRREFVVRLLNAGRVPVYVDLDRAIEYRLFDPVKRSWYTVTKTEYDFAKYLLESGKITSRKPE